MKVAVTGGSGVVGGAVVRHLLEAGHDVSALARSPIATERVGRLGAVPVEGDVLDSASLLRLVRGAEVVYHVAGVNDMCSQDPELMWRVNVEGTRSVMTACRSEGVRRLVHTSSAVTVGEMEGVVGDENTVHRGFFLSEYERSKHAAERALLRQADGLDVVSVNPSSVQGPGRATGTGRIFLAAAKGNLPVLFDTRISLVDIDDCARGHLLAAERGSTGERYLLSGATVSMKEAMRLLSRATGERLRPWYVNAAAVKAAAAIVEWGYGVLGRQPLFCRVVARVMLHGHRYDGSKATRELGLVYTPMEVTIRRSLDWFEEQGLLSPARS